LGHTTQCPSRTASSSWSPSVITGQDQQPGRDQLVAEVPAGCREPEAGEYAGCLNADVVAAASGLCELLQERLQPLVLGEAKAGAADLGGELLVGGRHVASVRSR
jgi:hypothetical protein